MAARLIDGQNAKQCAYRPLILGKTKQMNEHLTFVFAMEELKKFVLHKGNHPYRRWFKNPCHIETSLEEISNRTANELLFTDNQGITVFTLDP